MAEVKQLLDDLRFALEADVLHGRRALQRLLTGPVVVTPTPDGFEFAGSASWEGWDSEQSQIVQKNEALTGRIERRHCRSEGMWPRGDSNTRHAV